MQHTTLYERDAPPEAVVAASLVGTKFGVAWLDDVERAERPRLATDTTTTDLVVVGGGFCGLWTAVLAKRRDPGRRVVLLEAKRIGWAASGRNGGWVDYSITHGSINGDARWPKEFDELERLGFANLAAMERDLTELGVSCDWERVGALQIATEPHQVEWTTDLDPHERTLTAEEAQAILHAPGILGAIEASPEAVATVHPGKLVAGLAAAAEALGVEIFERSRVRALERGDGGRVVAVTDRGRVVAEQAALATNVFPALLRRNRLMTVPVYDYVLMTEPLTTAQRAAIGWAGRQGLGDMANQFHYSQLTSDGRILWGGYDAVYFPGGRIKEKYEDDPAVHGRLASHFFALFPQLAEVDGGVRFSHRWAGAIDTSTRFTAFYGTARKRRIAYTAGYTGLGVGAVRFGAEVMLDLLDGAETERTELEMVRRRGIPFPPEPAASVGINLSRWSLDRADHREGRRNAFLMAMDAIGFGFDS